MSRLLAVKRILHFVPYASQQRNYAQIDVNVEVPLFPGYVFFHGTEEDARMALDCEGVVDLVPVQSVEQLQWELSNLFMAMKCRAPLAECSPVAEGTRAEVFDGPMKGLQGYLGTHGCELVLQVAYLNRAVSFKTQARRARVAAAFRSPVV